MQNSRILGRGLEFELEMLIQIIVERVRILAVLLEAYLNRILIAVNRFYGQVQRVNRFTVIMRRVHRRYTCSGRIQRIFDVLVVSDRVIYTRGRQNTVVPY